MNTYIDTGDRMGKTVLYDSTNINEFHMLTIRGGSHVINKVIIFLI